MKNIFLFVCMLAMALTAHSQDYLKLMSYNIRNTKGMDNVRNVQRIANVINNEAPDVVAVQELDSMTTRSNQTYVLAEVAERTQMHANYAPAISFQGGKYGIGILSKEQPLSIRTFPLPGREEKRMLMIAEFKNYFFACTHLSLTEEDRLASLDIIKNNASTSNKPFFLAGDLNDTPDSKFIKSLQQDFQILTNTKKPTYPAPEPKETIDYIAAWKENTDNFANLSTQVVEEPLASDHRPITVTLRMAKKADELFLTQPYVQNPVNNGITILWETTIPAYSWVEYGTDKANLKRVRLIIDGQAEFNESIHKIRLDNLTPGQTYYYRVCSQEILQYKAYSKKFGNIAQSDFYTFTMPEADADSFTAVIFNDLHQRGNVFQGFFFGSKPTFAASLGALNALIVYVIPKDNTRPPIFAILKHSAGAVGAGLYTFFPLCGLLLFPTMVAEQRAVRYIFFAFYANHIITSLCPNWAQSMAGFTGLISLAYSSIFLNFDLAVF